jgi:uncharacterized protein (DUF2267 family)
MLLDFEKYAARGHEFINHLQVNLRNEDRSQSARVLNSTFRVLRNHLTLEESMQLLSQLPMAIKAIYVDGWRIADHKKVKTTDEFLFELLKEDGVYYWKDFESRDDIITAVRAVLDTLRLYVSDGEMNQALGTLPFRIREAFEAAESED